jgi:LysM repeat protein
LRTHKIRKGDTLGKIARAHGVTVAEIRRVNPEIINANLIHVGQVVDIPGSETESREEPVEETFDADPVAAEIVTQAKRFVNLHEIESNARWDDPATAERDAEGSALRRALEEVEWQEGWPYCAAFCEAVWRLGYGEIGATPTVMRQIARRLNPSVMSSFRNWKEVGGITRTPTPGSIFFMQKGRTDRGHAGIVVRVFDDRISTIEGNTSPDPKNAAADREGDGVFKRSRALRFEHHKGLWLRGFLNPVSPG